VWRIQEIPQSSFELAKWAAVLSMIVDHYGKIVDPSLYVPTHLIGRISFPLFAWIIASRLALRPDLAMTYVHRLVPWALISQPVFWFAGREWYEPNILFELLAGVLVVAAMNKSGRTWKTVVIALTLAGVGWFFDYGPAGVLSIAAIYLATQRSVVAGLAVLGAVGVLVNLPVTDTTSAAFCTAALAASLVALLSLRAPADLLPRLPTLFFYAFYPLHLLVFAIIAA
jgi:hypothetical protein